MISFIKKSLRPIEILYIFCISIICLFLIYRVTPVSGIDEEFHFYRAQQVAQGDLFAQRYPSHMFGGGLDGNILTWVRYFNANRDRHQPSDVNTANQIASNLNNDHKKREVVQFPSTASYSPLMYIPSATGMVIANIFHSNVDTRYYAGRLGNLFGYIFILSIVISILPTGRLSVLALMSTPTALHLATTYSADPVTNLGALLFLACCLRTRIIPLEQRQVWLRAIIILSIPLGLFKLTCSLLSLGCLIVPRDSFATPKKYIYFCSTVVGLSIFSAIVWNGIYPFDPAHYWNTGGDPKVQIHTMLSHPGAFIHEIGETYRVGSHWWWEDAWGRFGGGPEPLFFKVGEGTGLLAASLIIVLALVDQRSFHGRLPAMILISIGFLYSLFVLLAFYVGFTHLGENTVSGLQGRYFFLSAALIIIGTTLLLPKQKKLYSNLSSIFLFIYFICVTHVCIEATGIYAHIWN